MPRVAGIVVTLNRSCVDPPCSAVSAKEVFDAHLNTHGNYIYVPRLIFVQSLTGDRDLLQNIAHRGVGSQLISCNVIQYSTFIAKK